MVGMTSEPSGCRGFPFLCRSIYRDVAVLLFLPISQSLPPAGPDFPPGSPAPTSGDFSDDLPGQSR